MILHLDMDAFFASVEQLDNPSLRGKPVIVGGGVRGVVAAASYEARVFGVHSAMPVARARALCPDAVFLRGNFARYRELSRLALGCLATFSPIVQQTSIDEAYADITLAEKEWGSPEKVVAAIKRQVREKTGGLTCSAGVAPIKFLAKICSDYNKPDGVYILYPEQTDEFLAALDIDLMPGVGKRMSQSLKSFGVKTAGHLRRLSREFLIARYGKFGAVLLDRAFGVDPRPVRENPPPKSEGSERTFGEDIFDKKALARELYARAERVSESLRKRGERGRVVTLKVKFADFRQITRARTLPERTDSPKIIFAAARDLLDKTPLPKPVRLIGVSVSGFQNSAEQFFLPGFSPLELLGKNAGKSASGAALAGRDGFNFF